MKKALGIVLLGTLLSNHAHADMPDCISGICLRQAYSREFFKVEGFEAKEDKCEGKIYYSKNNGKISLFIQVLTYPVGENEAYTPFAINRAISFGKERSAFVEATQAILDKYGEPERRVVSNGEDPSAYYDYRYGGEILKSVKVAYQPNYSAQKWMSFEELEDLRGQKVRLERFAQCQKEEKAKEASKIIPD